MIDFFTSFTIIRSLFLLSRTPKSLQKDQDQIKRHRLSFLMGEVLHDEKLNQFYVKFEDGSKAQLDYKPVRGKQALDLYHTEVPEKHRKNGVAEKLVTTAFDFAADKNFKIIPTCEYVQRFVKKHGQVMKYAKLILKP
uniref:Protein NATD1 n=1 Tax=Romanomermis culicivorax TaxID=13658 RepID=A0A915K459_ROMCU